MENEMVTISCEEYEELLETQRFMGCLEGAGVDNWDGYDYALEDFHAGLGEDK